MQADVASSDDDAVVAAIEAKQAQLALEHVQAKAKQAQKARARAQVAGKKAAEVTKEAVLAAAAAEEAEANRAADAHAQLAHLVPGMRAAPLHAGSTLPGASLPAEVRLPQPAPDAQQEQQEAAEASELPELPGGRQQASAQPQHTSTVKAVQPKVSKAQREAALSQQQQQQQQQARPKHGLLAHTAAALPAVTPRQPAEQPASGEPDAAQVCGPASDSCAVIYRWGMEAAMLR